MKAIGAEYETVIQAHIETKEMRILMYSTLSGKPISDSDCLGAKYWRESLESPVLFLSAVKEMVHDNNRNNMFFIEVGPHSALSGPLRQIMKGINTNFTYCPTVVKSNDQLQSLLNTFGHSYLQGIPVKFNAVNGKGNTLKELPLRPWQNEDIGWIENRLTQAWRFRQFPHHELLGSRTLESSDIEPSWRNVLRVRDNPWIWQHKILNEIVFPGAGYIAMVVEAISQITGSPDCSIKHLHWKSALVLQSSSEVELLTSFRPLKLTDSVDSVWYEFTICSYNGGRWMKHCAGQARAGPDQLQLHRTQSPFTRSVSSDLWYAKVDNCGLNFGPCFRMLKDITADPNDQKATAVIVDDIDLPESKYAVHPAVIDQCLQLFAIAACRGLIYQINEVGVPLFLEKAYVSTGAASMSLSASMTDPASGERKGDSTLTVDDRVVISMEGVTFFSMGDPAPVEGSQVPIVSHVEWRPSVDMIPPWHFFQSNVETGPLYQIIAKLTLLSLVEAASRLRSLRSNEAYLVKYKNWVETEVIRIHDGAYSFIPEAQEWTQLDSEARYRIHDAISASPLLDMHQVRTWKHAVQKSWEMYGKLYAGDNTAFLEFMMEGNKLRDIYGFSVAQMDWEGFLSSLGHSNPQLRVLEVGAGTCAATVEALRCLTLPNGIPLFSMYAVTDISPAFLQAAKATLAVTGNIEYFVLDISQDPVQQGFESQSFDLIIASNVCFHLFPTFSLFDRH